SAAATSSTPGTLSAVWVSMKPMMPMPIVAIWIRSLGPAAGDGSTVRFSSCTSCASAVVAMLEAADAAATAFRNERRESVSGSCIVCSERLEVDFACAHAGQIQVALGYTTA